MAVMWAWHVSSIWRRMSILLIQVRPGENPTCCSRRLLMQIGVKWRNIWHRLINNQMQTKHVTCFDHSLAMHPPVVRKRALPLAWSEKNHYHHHHHLAINQVNDTNGCTKATSHNPSDSWPTCPYPFPLWYITATERRNENNCLPRILVLMWHWPYYRIIA